MAIQILRHLGPNIFSTASGIPGKYSLQIGLLAKSLGGKKAKKIIVEEPSSSVSVLKEIIESGSGALPGDVIEKKSRGLEKIYVEAASMVTKKEIADIEANIRNEIERNYMTGTQQVKIKNDRDYFVVEERGRKPFFSGDIDVRGLIARKSETNITKSKKLIGKLENEGEIQFKDYRIRRVKGENVNTRDKLVTFILGEKYKELYEKGLVDRLEKLYNAKYENYKNLNEYEVKRILQSNRENRANIKSKYPNVLKEVETKIIVESESSND